MFAKTGLVSNGYLVWETEAQRDETTYPGPLCLLQELSEYQLHTRCPGSDPDGKGSVVTSSQLGGLSGMGR